LPVARPGRVVPQRSATYWLLLAGDRVYLEKRPLHGIWGGLLVPPEGESLPTAWRQTGLVAASAETLPAFSHTFTHFRLLLQPRLLRLDAPPGLVNEGEAVWLPLDQLAGAALPTPIRKLLQNLADALT
jgi:A/G-specific adenine glycosylase